MSKESIVKNNNAKSYIQTAIENYENALNLIRSNNDDLKINEIARLIRIEIVRLRNINGEINDLNKKINILLAKNAGIEEQ